jgi:PAS domain S-box-containing protein
MNERALRLLVPVAITGAYFVAGRTGLAVAYVNESTSTVWPPAGIAVASLLLCGLRVWPAIALGAFLVNVSTSGSVAISLAIAAGNTLEAVVAARLVERFARGRAALERTRDILRFTALGAIAPTTIAASIGTAAVLAAGRADTADAGAIWLTWWLGDAVGIVVVAPLIILWVRPAVRRLTTPIVLEIVGLAACLVAVALVVFGNSPVGARRLPTEFLTVPVLVWAAFRFGARVSATASAVLSVFAIVGTLHGFGPFVRDTPNASLLLLQAFVGVITVMTLSVASEVAARWRVEGEMRGMNQVLEARVAARTEELTRVHDRLIEAQQVAHVGSWEWDVGTNAIWWSDELSRIYGVGRNAPATYEGFLAHVHPEDRAAVERAVAGAADDGHPFTFDHRIVLPDGAVRVVHAQGRVLADASGRTVRMVGTGHDITERVAAETQRAELAIAQVARREAEQASRAKDEFLATLSHELRTPLNVALGWTHLVREAKGLDPESARALETVYRNLQMLTRLVSDIVDASRIAAGALTLAIDEIEVSALVADAVETVRQPAAARAIRLETSIAPSVPPLRGDQGRLQQVIWNLLSNAVKFVGDGGRVMLSVTYDAGAVQIVVEDDGPGIPSAFLPYVFEEFRQADSSASRQYGGLGLGLAIARHLVHMHGGSITAGNRRSGGAIFTVRFPVDSAVVRGNMVDGVRL